MAGVVVAGCTGGEAEPAPTTSSTSFRAEPTKAMEASPQEVSPSGGEPGPNPSVSASDELGYSVSQQLAASPRDRVLVQQRVEGLQGRYAAETWSVFTSVNEDGTGVSDARVWMLGPEGTITCSGSGAAEWTALGEQSIDSDELPCGPGPADAGPSGEGVAAPAAPLPARASPRPTDAESGGSFPETFTVASARGTVAWVGVHSALADDAPAAALAEERRTALADLGDASPRGSDRAVVEADGAGTSDWIDMGVAGESGRTYTVTASCRGEGEFRLLVGVSDTQGHTVEVECGDGGPVTDEVTYHGPYSSRTVLVAGSPHTRGVLALDLSPAAP